MGLSGRPLLSLAFTLGSFALLASAMPASGRTVTVGVVRDGPMAGNRVQLVENELVRVVDSDVQVRFKSSPRFDAGWDPTRYRPVVEAALADPEVELVLLDGLLVLEAAAAPDLALTKPVVGGRMLRADVFAMPRDVDGRSGKENLSFILSTFTAGRDILDFRRMTPFERMHVLMPAEYERSPSVQQALQAHRSATGLEIEVLALPEDWRSALDALPEDEVEVAVITLLPRIDDVEREALLAALKARRVPVLSLEGHADVRLGALAANSADMSQAAVRRVALNLAEIIRGAGTGDLPVALPVGKKLVINGRTASAVGYSPDAETRARAEILHPEALEAGALALTFAQALAQADSGNTSLTIADAALDGSRHDVGRIRSPLLPQIDATGTYFDADPKTLEGIIPDRALGVGLSVRQMIYDDRAVSDYRAQKRVYRGSELDREVARLDVLADAGSRFLEFVLARLLYQVQVDNTRLTEDNLELARRRFEIGHSGRDEVYRWQAQLSSDRASLLGFESEVDAARIRLNQTLGTDQARRWIPQEIPVDSEVFPFLGGRIDPVFDDPRLWSRFEDFAVQLAIESAPEVESLGLVMEAQGIQLGQRTRRWFLPTFGFGFDYNYQIDRTPEFGDIPKDFHALTIEASYPLLEGTFRLYDRRRIQSDLTQVERRQRFEREVVERRARTAQRRISNSFPAIRFSRDSAENSARNFEVVQEKYAQGIVGVTHLLDAQNQSLNANQAAAISVYRHLLDLVDFQRSIAWFEDDKTAEDQDLLLQRIDAAVNAQP